MPIPSTPLRRGDRGAAVADLHRTLEAMDRAVEPRERATSTFGAATEELLRELQGQSGIAVTGVFDDATRAVMEAALADTGPCVVYGTLTDADGLPIEGATVLVVDVDLLRDEVLGRTTSDVTGGYEVRYSASDFARAEKESADVLVRAVRGDDAVAESAVTYNAPPELRIDLTSTGRFAPPELERLDRELEPLLDGGSRDDLGPTQVQFLAGETGLPVEVWAAYVRARALVLETELPMTAHFAWQRMGQPSTWKGLRAVPIPTLRTSALDAIDRNLVPRGLSDDLDAILAKIPSADRDTLAGALELAAVPPDISRALVGRLAGVAAVSDRALEELVQSDTVTPDVAERIGLAVSLHHLTGGDLTAASTVMETGNLRAARDLAMLEPADWHRAFERAGVTPPPGTTLAAHARTRAIAATRAFPETAFRHRATRAPDELAAHLTKLRPLLRTHDDLLDRPLDAIDGLSDRDRDELRVAHAEVRALVNSHPGLGLHEVVAKGGGDAADTITTRLGWISTLLERNPDAKLTELDLLPGSPDIYRLDYADLTHEQRELVVADFRAQRRMDAVTGDAVRRHELMAAGYSSASKVARTPTVLLADQTGIEQEEMAVIQGHALYLANLAAVAWFGIYDHTRDTKTTPVRMIPSRQEFFYPLAGYAQLLNDQPWCACEECQSVLSPAAYFVDTLHYIERFILAGSFAGKPTHPLHLEQRRPDLWDLPLSCENTNDVVPTLDIVNELLAKYIRDVVALPPQTNVFAHLAEQDASVRQPFTLPIAQIDTLLGHFGLSRHAIALAMGARRDTRARARLGFSPRDYALVTTERIDASYLQRMFGIVGAVTQPDAPLGAIEMASMVTSTGVDHDALAAALTSAFVAAGTPGAAVTVVLGKRNPTDVQNNTEIVNDLTLHRLDRLHRFLRLWRALPWSVVELDYTLGRLAAAGAAPQIVPDTPAAPGTLERVTALLELADAWSVSVEQVLAITDAFPTRGLRGDEPLVDRLFNPKGFAERDGRWTEQTTGRFTHPTWSSIGAPGVASPNDNTHARLLAGLQLKDSQLVALVAAIRTDPALDYRAGSATASESISFGRAAIASLYRHARVRALLGLSVEDFVGLLSLPGGAPAGQAIGYLRDTADVHRLAELAAWRTTSGLSVGELSYLVTGLGRPADVPDPKTLARDLPAAVSAAADDATRAELAAGTSPLTLLDLGLASQLDRSPDEIALLRACAATPAAPIVAAVLRALEPGAATADTAELVAYVGQLVRFHRLFAGPAFTLDGLSFVRRERARFFGNAPGAGLAEVVTTDVIRRVVAFRQLVAAAAQHPLTAPGRIAAIRAVVTGAPTTAQRALALAADESIIAGLVPHLGLSGEPFADLALVAANLALATTLGVGGETFALMTDESNTAAVYTQLQRAADDVLGAFRAKYPDPRTLRDKLEPYEDILRGRRRDGLVDYLITRWPTPFASADRLAEYFLMDVLVGGCARTSRIVAATGSLQLYVHRVLMNLERSADWNESAGIGAFARFPAALTVPDGKRRDEWQWRKYYRVWQANRKVFLYPENYLEPELRDDKTPLFEELEDALLGGELTKQNINDAYTQYLTGFDGLSRLHIAGAYRDKVGKTLHLFGVTQDDAPVYYYRSIDESRVTRETPAPVSSPWHKVPLSIPVRKVSPFLFQQRLYVFWVETSTRSMGSFAGGGSYFSGYRHSMRIRYSTLRLDGTWAAPQLVRFQDRGGISDARIVEDPVDTAEKGALQREYDSRLKLLEPRQKEKSDAITALPGADKNLADCLIIRDVAVGQLVAAQLIPEPVSKTIAVLVAGGILAGAQVALDGAQEGLRLAHVRIGTATMSLAMLEKELANRLKEINEAPARARWDRSRRNHYEALDSYRPEGWAWERVYPEVHTPVVPEQPPSMVIADALRLTLAPYANEPPPTDGDPIRTGDFDVVTGVLRDLQSSEVGLNEPAPSLNWSAGSIQTVTKNNVGSRGTNTAIDAYWLERAATPGVPFGLAPVTAEVQVVMGLPDSIIVENEGDAVWMRRAPAQYSGVRLGTTLTRSLQHQFMIDGPTTLLDASFQRRLATTGETRSQISPIAGQSSPSRQSPFHLEHLWLPYYRETFFHIPWLLADYKNTEENYAAAQRWYHTIFDPTAADGNPWRAYELTEPDKVTTRLRDLLVSSAALEAYRKDPFSPHAIARTRMSAYAKSIVMKYVDNLLDWGDSLFAQFTMESINEATMLYVMARDILGPRPPMPGSCGTGAVTRTYRSIRAGLTDVSDLLIDLETPRAQTAVTATGYVYVIPAGFLIAAEPVARQQAPTAQPRPRTPLAAPGFGGPGGGGPVADLDAAGILTVGGAATPTSLSQLGSGHTLWTTTRGTPVTSLGEGTIGFEPAGDAFTIPGTDGGARVIPGDGVTDFAQGYGPDAVGTRSGDPFGAFDELHDKYGLDPLEVKYGLGDVEHGYFDPDRRDPLKNFHADPVEVVPPKETVFCIPPNKELLGYWDRVEDRLWKVRSCMDISGARRRPELFAPELDPAMLVRMTAAGLSIDDILGLTAGPSTVYRFAYLVDKAKQHAGTVQSFGAQLLSALEKADAEELNQLRNVHEQNLLKLRGQLATVEIDAAEETLASLRAQREAVEYRRQHFVALRTVGSLPQERTQQDLQKMAGTFRTAAGIAQTVAAILTVIPDFGAWTAMKFGGSQLGAAGRATGEGLGHVAGFLDTGAALAGVAGSIARRDEEWVHQQETARRELEQIDRSLVAAGLRRDIATRSLEVHNRTATQAEEMYEFFRDRFSNVDRYRLLVKDLRRLYKLAFDSALRLAQLAEKAYRDERQDDDASDDNDTLAGHYWDAGSAGLLAGEKLLADLQRLERQYLTRNKRKLELEHSFSLAQLAPDKLDLLRRTGVCSFAIPEWFFDLSYPGHYRRRIKAVRLSMPCVTGPYVNVGATLRLVNHWLRPTGAANGALMLQPLGEAPMIATSKAQLDGGVFELSFRDERYMPFEGAGAVSEWSLSLPKGLRTFDYDTIGDVIVHLQYTADHSTALVDKWDAAIGGLVALLRDVDKPPQIVRRISLRDDLPDVFHRLVHSPVGTEVPFTLDERYFAGFLADQGLTAAAASLSLVTRLANAAGTRLAIANQPVLPETEASYTTVQAGTVSGTGKLREVAFGSVLQATPDNLGITAAVGGGYLLKFDAAGALAPPATPTILDPANVHDVVLELLCRVAPAAP